ncbi:MFS transporter [bacterium]|nr:MFS transporter [bacterium]
MSDASSGEKTVEKLGFMDQLRSFPGSFWTANLMEMFERLAYFGVRAVVGIYIVDAAAAGGLELSHEQRGIIFTFWALIQALLPMFTGGFSDRYGYKKSLYLAFGINAIAYVLMGLANSYVSFFAAALLLATGTAIFKPPLHGTLAHTVDERNSSLGWGVFYQLVNIGGFLGPIIAAKMRLITWEYVFFASAIIIVINFIPTIFIFKDYSEDVRRMKKEKGEAEKSAFATFGDSMSTLIKDPKFMVFLLIFSGFWLMFMQLFDTFPIFIDEWVDSRGLVAATGIAADRHGNIPPEMMINLDAGAIVILMPLIGYLTGKFKPVVMMVLGMFISTLALVFTGMMNTGLLVLVGIFAFAVGEMVCSPKFSEYIGLMAPPEKKALYLGYSNIPFAIGWTLAGWLSGVTYGRFSDKYEFARLHLVDELGMDPNVVANLSREDVLPTLASKLNMDVFGATNVLWDKYDPWVTWWIFGAIGLLASIAMLIYHFWLEADKKKQAAI